MSPTVDLRLDVALELPIMLLTRQLPRGRCAFNPVVLEFEQRRQSSKTSAADNG